MQSQGFCLNALAGGRIFPGVHHLSEFTVNDADGQISMKIVAEDFDKPLIEIEAEVSEQLSEDSVFASLEESSKFFEAGCVGYSSRPDSCQLDGLLLKVSDWQVSPLAVNLVQSSYYDDRTIFPSGSIEFDHALLMRDIPHEWHSVREMTTSQMTSNK